MSDFLGCHSVYSKGYANDFAANCRDVELGNGVALCGALEVLLAEFGPMSIAYGAIGPQLSDRIVKYQDPRKPSHHLWSLGAAADILVHNWIAGDFIATNSGLVFPENAEGSPITLAHAIEDLGVPYSRMLTYSESPYICLAVAYAEVNGGTPRRAFYENRYEGHKGAKPSYRQYSSDKAKNDALWALQQCGLDIPWEGHGYPTYHGGGFKQYQHMRVSRYTMVSDWLFDLKSISNGAKNIPSLNDEKVQDAFAAAGTVYDWVIDTLEIPRASIVGGYVSPSNPHFDKSNDWRGENIRITLCMPQSLSPDEAAHWLFTKQHTPSMFLDPVDGLLEISFNVPDTLDAR